MELLGSIRKNWGLLRIWGFGFCSIDHNGQLYISLSDYFLILFFNIFYLSVSWYYILAFFFTDSGGKENLDDEMKGAKTYTAVSTISLFAEQIANTFLMPMSLMRQKSFTDICNQLNAIDLSLDSKLRVKEKRKEDLRTLYWSVLLTIAYFNVTLGAYALLSNETLLTAYFQILALSRPLVSDCMNLQFMSIVLVINGRIRRVRNLVREGKLSLEREGGLHSLLLQLGECIERTNREFSLLFLLQSTRIVIAIDNNLYQVLILIETGVVPRYWILLLFLLNIILYSLGVHIAMNVVCHRTQTVFEELSRTCNQEARLDRQSEISLHLLHQRQQRHDRGFGFSAFGVGDIDRRGLFLVGDWVGKKNTKHA